MAEVKAVKKLETVNLISHLLEIRCSKQMSDVWNIGLNLALRISDLLSIKFSDIKNDRLLIKQSKTGKLASIKLNQKVIDTIQQIQAQHPTHTYLFQSYRNQQSLNSEPKPLSRRYVISALRKMMLITVFVKLVVAITTLCTLNFDDFSFKV